LYKTLAQLLLYLLGGGGGPPKRFSERLLNKISGLAGSQGEPVKGYEPQSFRTMYRPLRPASLDKLRDEFSRSTPSVQQTAGMFDDKGS